MTKQAMTKIHVDRRARIDWEAVAKDQLHPLRLAIIEMFASGDGFSPVILQGALSA